jgi:murein L,D-transpeptidase YafK
MPAYILQLPASVSDVFIAETDKATMHRYERSASGVRLSGNGYMSIGQNGAGKQRAWDRKTPLGIYFIVDQLDTTRLHEKYGVTAFPLDYPNSWDRRNTRNGDGIWVHGVLRGGGRRPPRDTDGCIALPNEDLLALEKNFVPLVTPVIITRALEWAPKETLESRRAGLQSAVEMWAESYASADVHAYLSMYADDFSYRGMTIDEWASFRLQSFSARGAIDTDIDELLLLADPEEDGLYLSRFRQRITGATSTSVTTKRLYWRQLADGAWKIVAEDNG